MVLPPLLVLPLLVVVTMVVMLMMVVMAMHPQKLFLFHPSLPLPLSPAHLARLALFLIFLPFPLVFFPSLFSFLLFFYSSSYNYYHVAFQAIDEVFVASRLYQPPFVFCHHYYLSTPPFFLIAFPCLLWIETTTLAE